MTTTNVETGDRTGTPDKDYNLIWFTEACLDNVLRLDTYIQDARRSGDADLEGLFMRAQANSLQGAEEAKDLLRTRLDAGG
ncbi:hypothetical protein FB381_2827 [Nocardioides albertanoniae]|uniref:Ferritin-like metal-binding protein YciE n=1 Tax=Nocardioides albertanoniae TaxID=1175486 RepID=A0A543A8W1_9ACTN|nr:hypothetical protein [Nocardioides albertanoniae]TQL68926.1 hypothetical protein FB381_2827 [Nocardioides albertanoniae]